MRILLFGKNGQVGWELQRTLPAIGDVIAVDLPEIDFTDLQGLRDFTLETKPDLIVNAAAYTAVDKAESEPEIAMRVNGEAPGVLAEVARKLDIGLIHYSTDYVFDGTKGEPYTEEDEPNPINVYGETKLAGDLAIQGSGCSYLILRTSWVYSCRGRNIFLTIINLAREEDELRIVDDQIGCPTWSRYISNTTYKILDELKNISKGSIQLNFEHKGVYNLSSSGITSWYHFSQSVLNSDPRKHEHIARKLVPVKSIDFPTPAKRPRYSVLSNAKLRNTFGIYPLTWQEHLAGCWDDCCDFI